MEGLYQQLRKNKLVGLFVGSGTQTLDLLANHLHPLTLQFKNDDLERHYYSFTNEASVPYIALGLAFTALLYFVYIPLDMSYSKFVPLLILRVVSGGILLIALAIMFFNRFVRSHCVHLMTILLSFVTVSAMLSLIFRDDVGFAPLFMVLLFGNLHCAAFAWHRAITGSLLILAQALVWIFCLNKEPQNFLRTQTLSYALFYISAILASYIRELGHRRVYFIIHDMLLSASSLKHYSSMLSSPAENLAKSRSSKRFSVMTPRPANPTSPTPPSPLENGPASLNASSEFAASIPPLTPDSPASSLAPLSTSVSPCPSDPTMDTSTLQKSPSMDTTHSSEMYDNLQDNFQRILDRVYGIMSFCIPPRGDVVMSEIGYHRAVYMYVRRLQRRVTQKFRDPIREKRFKEWHVQDTSVTLRRFLLLNIISIAFLTIHDFTSFPFTSTNTHILVIVRFGAIMPAMLISLVLSLWPAVRNWRLSIVTTFEIVCAAASLGMGLYAWFVLKSHVDRPVMAYDLYFGYVVRFVVYGFCGMGLLWMQSTFYAAAILVLMFVTTTILGVPLALSPLIIIVIGFIISFYDEKTRRVEFHLIFYREEVLAYIRAKEQYEVPMSIHTEVSLSNLQDGLKA